MARLVLPTIVFFLTLTAQLTAQTGTWVEHPITGRLPYIYDMDMYDENFGVLITQPDMSTERSGIVFTDDGWDHWMPVPASGPMFTPPLPDWVVWRAVYVLDNRLAYVVGDSAMVYKTFDKGRTWQQINLPWDTNRFMSPPTLHDIVWADEANGMIVGGDGFEAMINGGEDHPAQVFMTTNGGNDWFENPVPPQYILSGMGALLTVDYAGGKYIMGGEFGLLLEYSGSGNYTPIYPISVSGMTDLFFTNIQMTTADDHILCGQRQQAQMPFAYRSILNGNRYVNVTPGNLPSTVKGMWAGDFLNANRGMIGAGRHYIGVSADGGFNYEKHSIGYVPNTDPMTAIKMVSEQSGFAVGGNKAQNTGYMIRFYGVPPVSDISNTDTELTFPEISCERSAEASFIIRNSGNGALTIDPNHLNFSPPEYEIVNNGIFPLTLPPGQFIEVKVKWTPPSNFGGTQVGTLSIGSNDPDHNPWLVRLEGKRNYGALSFLDEMQLSYGTCVGDTLRFPTPISATGNRNPTFVRMEFVSGDNDFGLLNPQPGTEINGSENFEFIFAPQDSAMRRGVYRIINGNPTCPDTAIIALNGMGQISKMTASATTIDFGEICTGGMKDTSITLQNIGNTFVSIGLIEYADGDPMFGSPDRGLVLLQDSSKTLHLEFKPWEAGDFEATYRIPYGLCTDTLLLTLKGKALETVLEFDPPSPVTVGPIFANRVTNKTITITNPGDTPAHITGIDFTKILPPLQFQNKPPIPMTLQPGGSTTFTLRFAPVDIGEFNTSVRVTWDARCPDTGYVEINARCVPNPEIEAPQAADLGIQPCSTPLRDTIIIKNKGNGPLVFYSISLSGADAAHFKVIQPAINDTAQPESEYPMIVEFNRPTEGESHAIIRLTHNDLQAGVTNINVTARRTVAEFTVEGDSTTEFFTRLFVPESRQFTIRNTSNQPLTITRISVVKESSVFSATPAQALPVPLSPGQSMTFDVEFNPNARGPFHPIVEIESDPCGDTYALGLTGTGDTDGLAPDRGDITYLMDPCSFEESCEDIILKNQGLESVDVTGLTISQSGSVFSINPPLPTPFTLGPNQEQTITVCASPALLGTEHGTLIISSSDPAYPSLSVMLHATRDSVGLELSETDIDFGRHAICDVINAVKLQLTNTGNTPETVNISLQNGTAFTTSEIGDISIPASKLIGLFVEFTPPGYGSYDDVLIIVTESCQKEFRIPLHGELVEQQYAATPNPLSFPVVNVGGATTRDITFQNNGGMDATIGEIIISPTGTFSLQSGSPMQVASGTSETYTIRFNPQTENTFAATACFIITGPCADTICVDLQGEGVRGTLEVRPPLLAYGSKAQCEITTLNDTLENTGSGPITILSATIIGANASAFTNLTPVVNPESIPAGAERIFELRFDPSMVLGDGPVNAALRIQTDDGVLPVFDIPLEAERVTLVAAADGSVNLGTLEVNNPVSRSITLHNTGSVPLCYDRSNITFPPLTSATPAPPYCIQPGDSLTLQLDFNASNTGSFLGTMTLLVDAPCADSTVYDFRATAQEGALTQIDTVRLDPQFWCEERSFNFTIRSTYLEDITLESVQLEGTDASFFSILAPDPATLPASIASGATEQVSIVLNPDARTHTYTATFVSRFTAFGTPVERRTVLIARAVLPTVTVSSANWPVTVVGQSGGVRQIVIENTCELPLNIADVMSSNPIFNMNTVTPAPPAVLQSGEQMTADVEFLPTASGSFTDSLVVTTGAPCAISVAGMLEAEAIPQPIVDAILSLDQLAARVDDVIDVTVMVDADLGPAQVTGWTGSIAFNRSMLYPVELVKDGTLSSAMQVAMDYNNSAGELTITASGAEVAAGTGALITVRCLVLVGNSLNTTLRLMDDWAFTQGYARVSGTDDGSFELLDYCLPGDRLMTDIPGFVLHQNHPNPVSASAAPAARITYEVPADMTITLDLYDMIGRHVTSIDEGFRQRGVHTVNLGVAELEPGTYVYVLRSADKTAVRRMIIVR
ncbi:choice-of-anchor D domain-containing protein [bacterium]|nr:choice-of-anchor D domain-containing protein [bacterium]